MKTMAEAGAKFSIANEIGEEDYHVELPEGDYLLVSAGLEYGSSAAKFDSDKILRVQRRVHEFKHYANGRKWWTQKPGIDILMAIPKSKILMLPEKGYSYVPIEIGGIRLALNVSGGTGVGKGWTDIVHQGSSIGVFRAKKNLKILAEYAVIPEDIDLGPVQVMTEGEQKEYRELCAYHDTRSKIKVGDKVVLKSHYSIEGSQGPFSIIGKQSRKRSFICVSDSIYSSNFKVTYKHIDWTKTAEVNAVALV